MPFLDMWPDVAQDIKLPDGKTRPLKEGGAWNRFHLLQASHGIVHFGFFSPVSFR